MIIEYLIALLFSSSLIILVYQLRVLTLSNHILKTAGNSLIVLTDSSLIDDLKEKELQKNTLTLLKLFILLLLRLSVAILLSVLLIYIFELLYITKVCDIFKILITPMYLIIVFVVMSIAILMFRKNNKREDFGLLDKIIHKIAFNSYNFQNIYEKKETKKYKDQLEKIKISQPVFITSLPRAGTTILLEILSDHKIFCSHRYRDMPFLLTPIYWNKFSKYFRKHQPKQERKHQDGVMINNESPEALEEILWQIFFNFQIGEERVNTVSDVNTTEFADFFKTQIRKIIYIRSLKNENKERYVSKNNMNISRIPIINKMFPDAKIVIPFRNPLNHSYSLLKQHKNFLQLHKNDEFYKLYMERIGHFDFGLNLKPINFNNWLDDRRNVDYLNINIWLEYWINTYSFLLKSKTLNIMFFNYDKFTLNPQTHLEKLFKHLCINRCDGSNLKTDIHTSNQYTIDHNLINEKLFTRAQNIHEQLNKEAIK